MSNRRTHDSEFREGAVRIVMASGKPIAQVARDLGVNEGTLGNWVGKAREATGCADASLTESERTERGRLRSENAELRMHGVSPRLVVGRRCPKMINGLPHRLSWGFPHRRVFATRAEARQQIRDWISNFYNARRRHSWATGSAHGFVRHWGQPQGCMSAVERLLGELGLLGE